jgi:hypothetical protein
VTSSLDFFQVDSLVHTYILDDMCTQF